MPSKKVLTIGSALVDVFIKSDTFELDAEAGVLTCGTKGGKSEVDSFDLRTGGGASNTAVGFARMGFEALCIAEMGKDEQAQFVIDDLQKEKVETKYLVKEKKEQTGGSVILVTESGERMVLVHRGAASMLDPQDLPMAAFADVDWIHLSSIGNQFATLEHLFALVREKAIQLSWNPGSALLKSLVEKEWQIEFFPVKVFIVNKEEWQVVEPVQQRLLSSIPYVVVTDGSRGGVVYHHGQISHEYQGKKVVAVDNTGAGDAFAVGFVSAILAGKEVETATDWGAANAASVVQQVGAKPGLLSYTQVNLV